MYIVDSTLNIQVSLKERHGRQHRATLTLLNSQAILVNVSCPLTLDSYRSSEVAAIIGFSARGMISSENQYAWRGVGEKVGRKQVA